MAEKSGAKLIRVSSMILSVIFHPVFLPVYGLLIIFNAPTFLYYIPYDIKRIIFLLAMVNMTIVPLALMPFLKQRNLISSYSVETRIERVIPLGVGSMMYMITTFIFFSYQIPVLIKSFMLGASIGSFLLLVITFRWKISIHAAGMGGLLGSAMTMSVRTGANLAAFWVPLIIIAGLVMSARLTLGSHTPAQAYTGFLTGFFSFFLTMILM